MKKVLIAVALFAAASANASLGNLCAGVAEGATVTAESARVGVPWEKLLVVHRNSYPAGKKAPELILDITRESYFSWHSLEDKNIRTLAYTKCMAEMLHAIRQDRP